MPDPKKVFAPIRHAMRDFAEAPVQAPSRWQAEVGVPGRELAHALQCTTVALGRLSWGVLGYAAYLSSYLVAGRGRVLSRFESNPP